MNGKNSLRKVVCCLFVLCSMIGIMEAGRLCVQAAVSEKALYLEYLAKKEASIEKELIGTMFEAHQGSVISRYKIMDINMDGKKELIYELLAGGAKGEGVVCSIRDGKVKELETFGGSPQFFTVKGSQKQLVVGASYGALNYGYEVFLASADSLKKKADYQISYIDYGAEMFVQKNGKEISAASFQKWLDKLKKIKLDDYKTAKKTQTVSSEKEIYLKYLAKEKKRLLKKYYNTNTDKSLPDYLVSYKIIDLNGDGKKELVYTFTETINVMRHELGRICTIQNGKVKQLWEDEDRYVTFFTLKGSKSKIVVEYQGSATQRFKVYRVVSDKLKEIDSFHKRPFLDPDTQLVDYGYYRDTQEKWIKDPFGKYNQDLQQIELKVF